MEPSLGGADTSRVEAELKALGIEGRALEAVLGVVRLHARRSPPAVLPAPREVNDMGELARYFHRSSLSRRHFIGQYADDPAWNMLLAIYADQRRGEDTSISSACYASGSPPTTALRHLEHLRGMGVLTRRSDPSDNRRKFVELTAAAVARMDELLISFCVEKPQQG